MDIEAGGALAAVAGVALRSLVLLGVAGLLSLALRRSAAALRHLVWTTAIAGVLALPALMAVMPHVGVPLPELGLRSAPASMAADAPATATVWEPDPASAAHAGTHAGATGDHVGASGVSGATAAAATAWTGAHLGGSAPIAVAGGGPTGWPITASLVLLAIWLAGAVAVLLPVAAGWIGVRRLEDRSSELADTRVRHLATRLALRIGLKRDLRLLEGPAGTMPMTWGIGRPAVVLPAEASEWPDSRLQAVLLHELAHVKRRDCLTQLLAELVRALHWFDPLAWLAARRLRVERELACDDVALAGGALPSEYAGELLGLARGYRAARATTLAAVAMARPGQLAGRLLAVLDDDRPRGGVSQRAGLRAAGVLAVLTALLAAAAPAASGESVGTRGAGERPGLADDPASVAVTLSESASPLVLDASVVSGRLPQEATCAAAREEWNHVQHNSNDDVSTVRMRRPGCELEVRLEGDVEFDGAAIAVARLGPDARIRMEEDDGRVERYLEIRPGPGGAPTYDYRVNGREAAFDPQAQTWYRAVLLQLFRGSGFAAEERVESILGRSGVEGVLRELGQIESSYVFAKYAQELLERAELDEAELRALVRASSRRVDSDHYMAEILMAVADHQPLSGGMLDDFVAASMTLDSDHYRASVLQRVLEEGRLTAEQAVGVLESAANLDSDHYRAEVLADVADRYAREPAIRAGYLRVAAELDSDHYLGEVLGRLLQRSDLSAAERAEVLSATARLESDHYRTELLKAVAADGLGEEPLQRAYFEALAGIESDHYGLEALRTLLREERLPADLLQAILSAAPEIESDHYLTELLVEVAERFPLQGATRDAFLRAMESVESQHYRGQVAEALLRAERRI